MRPTRPSAAPSFPVALSDVRETRRAVVVDRERARRRGGLRRPPAVLYGGAIAGASNQRSSKSRRLSFYRRSISLDWARRDVPQPHSACSRLLCLSSGLRARCFRPVSLGRALGTCLRRVLIQRPPRLDPRVGCKASPYVDHQSAHHPGIKHERAARFKSSVSYNSSALRHDSQEQLCSKRSDSPAAPS